MNVSNANNHITVVEKHVTKPVTITPTSRKRNSSVVSAQPSLSVAVKRLAKLTEPILLNTSVNSAATYHNGSAGVTHISVNYVIRNNVLVITSQERVKISLTNAQVQRNVLSK